jgi:hypothetical protein
LLAFRGLKRTGVDEAFAGLTSAQSGPVGAGPIESSSGTVPALRKFRLRLSDVYPGAVTLTGNVPYGSLSSGSA